MSLFSFSFSFSFSFLLALLCVSTVVSSQSCSVSERTGCGFIGIDQATCVSSSYNCCWKDDVAPYCYQPALSSPSPSPPPPPPPPSGNSYQLTFTFTGGISFCSQCGANGEYACSDKSNWNGGKFTFTDATPPGYIVTKVQVDVLGSFACQNSGINDIQVQVNSDTVNILSASPTYQCACSTCDGKISFVSENDYGIPFNFRTNNTLTITPLYNVICLNSATLTVTFAKDQLGLTAITKRATYYSGFTSTASPGQCGVTTYVQVYDYPRTFSFYFIDPLPKGSILVSATFDLYGRFFSTSCPDNQTLSVSLGLAPALTETLIRPALSLPMNPNNCQTAGCDGFWRFPQDTLYQNGWPGYNYGTTNYVNIVNGSPKVAGVAFVDVRLWYLPFAK